MSEQYGYMVFLFLFTKPHSFQPSYKCKSRHACVMRAVYHIQKGSRVHPAPFSVGKVCQYLKLTTHFLYTQVRKGMNTCSEGSYQLLAVNILLP